MNGNELESTLKDKGWIKGADGNWSKPKRKDILGSLETECAEQSQVLPLDKDTCKRQSGSGRMDGSLARVTMVMLRKRLLDPDAVAFSMKPLTDAIAASLGVDDADPQVTWEWKQATTTGQEGVIVKIERKEKK